MLPKKQQLAEVIRLLEQDNHVFQNDPVPITHSLKASNKPMLERIISRATRIDASQQILNTITKVNARLTFLIFAVGVAWLVFGFLGLFALLHSQAVNFFYVLVSLLGFNTLMLFFWLALLVKGLITKETPHAWLYTPSFFIRKSDPITAATVKLTTQQLQQQGMRWYLGKINHQLWLATLIGMLGAIVFLLSVRQYNFNWQSTLLTSETLISLVGALAWLPSKFGFAVPSANDVVNSQHLAVALETTKIDPTLARKWSGLLIGSMLCYGIFPRALAWLVCFFMLKKQTFNLPLNHSYYQNLIKNWSTKVVDANDMTADEVVQAPKATLSKETNISKLACLLETPHTNTQWTEGVLNTTWHIFEHNQGLVDSRDDVEALIAHLENNDIQLLIGIRAQALPDRGMMRKLDKIAQKAKGGLIIKLINTTQKTDEERVQQWHKALAERGIGLVNN